MSTNVPNLKQIGGGHRKTLVDLTWNDPFVIQCFYLKRMPKTDNAIGVPHVFSPAKLDLCYLNSVVTVCDRQ